MLLPITIVVVGLFIYYFIRPIALIINLLLLTILLPLITS
jgi:hypothetical protein